MMFISYLLLYLFCNHQSISLVLSIENSVEELKNAPPDHIIPYSEHENPPEPSTKLKYTVDEWAKRKGVFIPTEIYAQVRGTHTVKRVPRKQAINEAKTEADKEAAKRLRESITDKKIHTVYTEEGYEDAAYDHGGYSKNADVHEDFELNKKDSDETNSEEIENYDDDENTDSSKLNAKKIFKIEYNPQKLIENEIEELEKNLEKENNEVEKLAETEIPENLKNLGVDKSSDNSNSDEDNVTKEYEQYKKKDKEFLRKQDNMSFELLPGCNTSPCEMSDRIDNPENPTTEDYGKIFWEFYKTDKPNVSMKNQDNSTINTTSITPEVYTFSPTRRDGYPSLSNIYKSWKNRGIDEIFDESASKEHATIHAPINSEEIKTELKNDSHEFTTNIPKKPDYITIIRPPKDNSIESISNDEVPFNQNYKVVNHLKTSVKPESLNTLTVGNFTELKSSVVPSLRQVTYNDFLMNSNNSLQKLSGISKESESSEEIDLGSMEYFPPKKMRPFRPKWRPSFLQMAGMRIQNYIKQLSHLLPPSPIRQSQYADYNSRRRRGSVKPQEDPLPEVFMYLKPPLPQVTGKLSKYPAKKVITGERKSSGYREKRSINMDLLNNAPRIVQDIVDKEIQIRFPKENNENDDDDDSQSKEELNEDERKKNIQIEIPDFDVEEIFENIKEHDDLIIDNKPKVQIIDAEKYPFFVQDKVPMSSALKYIINPLKIPKKTRGGMEFYESRDRYMQCKDIDPDLTKIFPEEKENESDEISNKKTPPLEGLGDKLSCLRAKYFDKNPLDNPLFMEEKIEALKMPDEFLVDSTQMKLKFLNVSSEPEARVSRKVSRKPEIIDLRTSASHRNDNNDQSTIKSIQSIGKALNNRKKQKIKNKVNANNLENPYQKEVYDDVMGTIKNLANMQWNFGKSTQSPEITGIRPPLKSEKRHKFNPYKTNKVIYKTKSRFLPNPTKKYSKNPEYFKTVKINKRSTDEKDFDLQVSESRIISRGNTTFLARERNTGIVKSTSLPEVDTESSSKVYTLVDRGKNSKNKDLHNFGKFEIESTTTDLTSKRNEPTYNSPRRARDDNSEVEKPGETGLYDVHEKINEETLIKPPEVSRLEKYPESKSEEDEESEETSKSPQEINEKNQDDQMERPFDSYKGNSAEKSEESIEESTENDSSKESYETANDSSKEFDGDSTTESYADEEKNMKDMSEAEKDFERFSYRPSSFSENYFDPKYADLGPRIHKPYFYHPEFEETVETEKNDNLKSKYFYPWNHEHDASEEMKETYLTRKFEYPWEKRERLANQRKNRPQYGSFQEDDGESSETKVRNIQVYPWEKYNVPLFDSDRMASENRPIRYSSQIKSKKPKSRGIQKIKQSVKQFLNTEINGKTIDDITTTINPQIPPTSATLSQKIISTKPTIEMTSTLRTIRNNVSPRPTAISRLQRRRKEEGSLKAESTISDVTSTSRPIRRRGRPLKGTEQEIKKIIQNNPSTTIRPRGRFRMTSTATTASTTPKTISRNRRRFQNISNKSDEKKTPIRTVEHRSRMSKEEIITKTMHEEDTPGNHTSMNKISITTKETPDHIYRTEETNKNGVKGMIISITPTNDTNSSIESSKEINMEDIEKEEIERSQKAMEDVRESVGDSDFAGDSIINDVHFLANLMHQVPPPLTVSKEEFDETDYEKNDDFINKSVVNYIKEPDRRFYSFIEEH